MRNPTGDNIINKEAINQGFNVKNSLVYTSERNSHDNNVFASNQFQSNKSPRTEMFS